MKFLTFAMAAYFAAFAGAACAQNAPASTIDITNPWIRAMPKGAKVAAGYVTITNKGSDPDRLVGISTDAAKSAEVHEMSMDNGVMRMRPVKGGLEVKPGATVELKPGSYHIMFMNPAKTLAAGDDVKATLQFEKAGNVAVEFPVKSMGAGAGGGKMAPMNQMAPMH